MKSITKVSLLICLVLVACMVAFTACGETAAETTRAADQTTSALETNKQPETSGLSETNKQPETSKQLETSKLPETSKVPVSTEAPHTHLFGEWTVVTKATCTQEGLEERYCSCGEKESKATDVRPHSYDAVVTDPTCTAGGYTTYTCSECRDSYTGDETEPKHTYTDTDAVCALCGHQNKSVGLIYTYDSKTDGYIVSGIGTCTDRELVIPSRYEGKSVTGIADEAFVESKKLISVVIPESVMQIGEWAFCMCESLTSVAIDNAKTSIGAGAFSACASLVSVTLGDGVTSIDEYAFADCISLTDIVIPKSVTKINDYVFESCFNLTEVHCEAESKPSGWNIRWLDGSRLSAALLALS